MASPALPTDADGLAHSASRMTDAPAPLTISHDEAMFRPPAAEAGTEWMYIRHKPPA